MYREKFWSLSSIPSFVLPLLITLTLIQHKSSGHETEVGRRRDLNCPPIFSRADHNLPVRRFTKRKVSAETNSRIPKRTNFLTL